MVRTASPFTGCPVGAEVKRALGWGLWGAVAALLALGGLSHDGKRAVERDLSAHGMPRAAGGLLRAARTYLAQDWDVQRAHAYVSAALGRPYRAFYIRSSAAWAEAFQKDAEDPDATAVVTPLARAVPYRDFAVEYPPGFFLWALPPAWVAHGADGYRIAFGLEMALFLTLAFALAELLQRRQQPDERRSGWLPAWGAGTVLALGVVVMNRVDGAVALTVTLAVWAALSCRPGLSGLALGLAVVSKLVPAVLLPVLAFGWWQSGRARSVVRGMLGFSVGVVVPTLPFLVAAGPRVVDAMVYQAVRPLQIETSASVLLGLVHAAAGTPLETLRNYGSLNLVGSGVWLATQLSSGLALFALLALYAWSWREWKRGAPLLQLSLATGVGALVVCFALGKVFSPQYLLWVLPLGTLLSCLAGRRFCVALVLVCLLSQAIFPVAYDALAGLSPWAFALLGVRNLLLVLWAVGLLRWASAKTQERAALGTPSRPVSLAPGATG
jgi:hypothetical protein